MFVSCLLAFEDQAQKEIVGSFLMSFQSNKLKKLSFWTAVKMGGCRQYDH